MEAPRVVVSEEYEVGNDRVGLMNSSFLLLGLVCVFLLIILLFVRMFWI